jgi:hydroxymethylpyrimidine/phosphomethylpyrimidine kinase
MRMHGRVLVIAGSDSGGGAGIQADIKTIAALGGYAQTAITALTAQDTNGVHAIFPVPPDFIRHQIRLALADIGADTIKTGMLGDAATIDAVYDELESSTLPLIVDPVMSAKGGASLLAQAAIARLKQRLLPRAAVLTPNIPEAEILTGLTIATEADMHRAGDLLLALGPTAIVLKGGHLPGDEVIDLLITGSQTRAFRAPRLESRHTHGTGCTLASAIAIGLAQGMSLANSLARARAYVRAAIATAPGFGAGHGPLNHAATHR